MSWKLLAVCSLVVFVLLSTTIVAAAALKPGAGPETPEYETRARILIDGNDDFLPENGVVSGSGTPSDPYLIDGWRIRDGENIEIGNTSQNFVLSNIVVRSYYQSMYGIYLLNVTGGRIENCTIESSTAGILIGQYRGASCSDITVSNVSTRSCRYGVVAHNSEKITIVDCMMSTSTTCGIYLNRCNNTTAARNFVNTETQFRYGGRTFAFFAGNCSRLSVMQNTIINYYGDGLRVENSTETLAKANDFEYCYVNAISLISSENSIIIDNYFLGEGSTSCGATLASSRECAITDNTFECGFISSLSCNNLLVSTNEFFHGGGINAEDFDNIVIEKNSLDGNGSAKPGHEISLYHGVNATISNNVITRFSRDAIFVMNSHEIEMTRNMVRGNQGYYEAINLQNSSNITLNNNSISEAQRPLSAFSCSDTHLDGNNVSGGYMLFHTCSGVRFVRNIFIDINQLAIDNCTDEVVYNNAFILPEVSIDDWGAGTWNSTYPEGGNFYSAHAWTDLFSGPNQDMPGSDGIGDSPFNIDSNSTDFYPLTAPPDFSDTTPPIVAVQLDGSRGKNEWFKSSVFVSVVAADLVSGVKSVLYRLDGNDFAEYSSELAFRAEGNHTLDVRSLDYRGNAGPVQSIALKLDWTPPMLISIEPPQNSIIYSTSVTITADCIDNESGVLYCYMYHESTYAYSKTLSANFFSLKIGENAFTMSVQDDAGNWLFWQGTSLEIRIKSNDPFSDDGPYGPWVQIAIAIDVLAGLVALSAYAKSWTQARYDLEDRENMENGPIT